MPNGESVTSRWHPVGTQHHYGRPEVGALIAHGFRVYRVLEVNDRPEDLWDDADREWVNAYKPEHRRKFAPYMIVLAPVEGGKGRHYYAGGRRYSRGWEVYPRGRWPKCSCCGEPMPCRAELADRQVEASMASFAKLESRLPGSCWECGEPVSRRQHTVHYPGENVDLPGAYPPVFHTRRSCKYKAKEYEERWLKADPRRQRILTWPTCKGTLVVHADGSSECHGSDLDQDPPCQGHVTHDHSSRTACYAQTHGCPRECGTHSRGCQPAPRLPRTGQAAMEEA